MANDVLDYILNSGLMTTLGAAVDDPLGAVAQSYMPQSALDRAYEGNTLRQTPGEFAQTALSSAGNIVGSPGALIGSMVENVSGSPGAGFAADLLTPDPGDVAKLGAAAIPMLGRFAKKNIPQGFAEDAFSALERLGQSPDVIPSARGTVKATQTVEDVAAAAGRRLDELAPKGTVFGDLMNKMISPKVGGSEKGLGISGFLPEANKVNVGTEGFQEGVSIEDLSNVLNHEKFHSFWAQITNLAAKGDDAAKFAQDKFTKVLSDVTGFRRPGNEMAETMQRAGLSPRVDTPHTPRNVPNISVEEALQANLPSSPARFERAAKYREGERLSDLFAMLLSPQGRGQLGDTVLDELSGILDFSGGTKLGPGFQQGGQVDANAVLQFLLQGLI